MQTTTKQNNTSGAKNIPTQPANKGGNQAVVFDTDENIFFYGPKCEMFASFRLIYKFPNRQLKSLFSSPIGALGKIYMILFGVYSHVFARLITICIIIVKLYGYGEPIW